MSPTDRKGSMTVTREPACPVKYCPARNDPDWHRCWCGRLDIEHHDAGAKGMGGGKDHHKRPENVVALCVLHHAYISRNEHSDRILDLPTTGRTYVYYDTNGMVLAEYVLEAGSAAAEAEAGVKPRSSKEERPPEPATGRERVGSIPTGATPPGAVSAAAPSASGGGSVAEPLDKGALPSPARDLSLVPTPSATPFSLETWCQEGMKLVYLGLSLRDATDGLRFAIGDWVNEGEQPLGEELYGYLRGFKEVTVRQYSWVAGRVRYRVTDLDWSHHRAVAALEAPKQKEMLEKAQKESLTSKELYREIHGEPTPRKLQCPTCGFTDEATLFRLEAQ